MTRGIAPGIHWIYETGPDRTESWDLSDRDPSWYEPGREVYVPQCAYLVDGGEETLLFDTLSPASTDHVLEAVDDLVRERGLDYLVVSHPDVPHAGNTVAILDTYPEATLVAPGYGNDTSSTVSMIASTSPRETRLTSEGGSSRSTRPPSSTRRFRCG